MPLPVRPLKKERKQNKQEISRTAVTKGLFKKSIFQWTELFCQTVKLIWQTALFKFFFKKNWAFKTILWQIDITRNARGHNRPKKNFFKKSIFVPKNGYFFLKKPFLTTKRAARAAHFGPKLPPGVNKNCVKNFVRAMIRFDVPCKSMTNMIQIWQQIWQIWTTNMTENTKKSPKITKITTNHHQHPPTNQYVPQIWFLVTICINYKVCHREKC